MKKIKNKILGFSDRNLRKNRFSTDLELKWSGDVTELKSN